MNNNTEPPSWVAKWAPEIALSIEAREDIATIKKFAEQLQGAPAQSHGKSDDEVLVDYMLKCYEKT